MKICSIKFMGACVFSALLVSPALAADNCSGTWNNVVSSSSTFEVAKGHTITSWVYNTISRSADSPLNSAGECSGYSITTPDGKSQMAGGCVRKALDGTTYTETWEMAPGADKGTWKYTGVSGKNAALNASGWWQMSSFEGKVAYGVWGGTCK